MQTAVEWLIEELKKFHHPTEAMIMYAKKLEKQQIIDAVEDCRYGNGNEYYNETYGSNGSDELSKVEENTNVDHIVDTNEMIKKSEWLLDELNKNK